MLKQSRHGRVCMNRRGLKCVENTRLATCCDVYINNFQVDIQTLCFLNDGELAMNLLLLGWSVPSTFQDFKVYICAYNQIFLYDLYFLKVSPQNKDFSNQNKGNWVLGI